MKRVFFLIAFLFSVVCYAGPPPGDTEKFAPETEMVSTLGFYIDVPANIQGIEAQEVAVFNIGYIEDISGTEKNYEFTALILFAELPANSTSSHLFAQNKPPSDNSTEGFMHQKALQNKQHTNYGYPLTANKVSRAA